MKTISLRILSVILLAALAAGCSTLPKLNEKTLVQLYAPERALPKKTPVIFIPGVMGSMLKDKNTGRTVWGVMSRRFLDTLALPIDAMTLIVNRDGLVASQPLGKFRVIPGLVEKEVYDKVRRIAIEAGGYEMDKNAFTLTYDWRRDLIEAVRQLGRLIDEIKYTSGQPDLKVDLLCHSAGGLIARYYIKYGTVDVLDRDPLPEPTYAGAAHINKVIMLGVPNGGSLEAFQRLHQGLSLPLIGYLSCEIIFTMPSVYEFLPFDGQGLCVDASGKDLGIDLYDPANWERYGWSVFNRRQQQRVRRQFIQRHGKAQGQVLFEENYATQRRFLEAALKRARQFHRALTQGDITRERQHVKYMLLGSACEPTLCRVLVKKADPGWQTFFKSNDHAVRDILYSFGDGVVTKDSLLGLSREDAGYYLPASSEVFVCEKHNDLVTSLTYLDNVLNMLLRE